MQKQQSADVLGRLLVLLGRSSLEAFFVHVLCCFAALSIVADGTFASWRHQFGIIVVTLSAMYVAAFFRDQRNSTWFQMTNSNVRRVSSMTRKSHAVLPPLNSCGSAHNGPSRNNHCFTRSVSSLPRYLGDVSTG
jgi:hypothetical protein